MDGEFSPAKNKHQFIDHLSGGSTTMKSEYDIDNLASLYKALGNPNRLKIYTYLLRATKPENVTNLERALDIKQSHLSQSLNILNSIGLVNRERDGSRVNYSINKEFLQDFNTFNKNFFKKQGIA
ncbi:MAG TPA: metalloregulator ArsR/SmtB family transcription factor [Spirochaetota bacterium]|nr:metalloregulator ArsR/SmtB family transcription factor [Spirochaetota bacterium]